MTSQEESLCENSGSQAQALRERIAKALQAARDRTRGLTECVDDADLVRQHSRLMSPLVWDLAHVGNQEELWLLRAVGGREPMHPEIDPIYDAFEHPRAERPSLPLLPPAQARSYVSEVRGRVLDLLERAPLNGAPLVAGGFAFGMVAQHEQQHDETMLITHQLRRGAPVLRAGEPRPAPPDAFRLPAEVLVPGGPFTVGTSSEPWALDNERPAHTVHVPAFYLDTTPVTNGAYLQFIADGGYDDPRWWSEAGWDHRQRAGLTAPLYWRREDAGWVRSVFGVTEPAAPAEPVVHVSWHEAQAYAAWAGRRLPTEAEGEHRPAVPAPRPGRQLPGGGRAVRRAPADGGRLGVDRQRLPALPGLCRLAVPGVLGGLLRRRVQGAARRLVRGRPGGLPGHVPQLGLPDPAADLRRLPHRPGRRPRGGRRREGMTPARCAATWPTSARPLPCTPLSSARRPGWPGRRGRPGASGTGP